MVQDYLLLRYLEEQSFVDMFMAGYIRFNSLDFFWGEHDEPTKDGQIDTREGLVCPIGAKSIDDCSRSDHYRYCNLLCCNRLNYVENGESVGWYSNRDMGKFGDYVVIIKDPEEFQRRLLDAANKQEFMCLCHEVEYDDKIDESRDVFNKEYKYAYQNEWRSALYRNALDCEPYVLFIGSIEDIAEWCYTKELDRRLVRIFSDRDYRGARSELNGNISREEFAKFFMQYSS